MRPAGPGTTLEDSSSTHLVESHHVNAATEVDVLGVETVDSSLLQSLLSEGVVSRESRGQHWVDHEGEDVEAVEETLPEGSPQADPHVEGVGHPDHSQGEEDSDRLEKVIVEGQVEGGREEDGPHQLTLGGHEACQVLSVKC